MSKIRMTRRQVLRGILATLLLGCGGASYPWLIEPHWIATTKLSLKLPIHHPLRIAQISDLHRSDIVSTDEIKHAVRQVNRLQPDLVVITGDFVTGSADYIDSCASILTELEAPLGTFAVLGNHDHWTNAERIAATLIAHSIHVLRNEAHLLPDHGLWIAGIDDAWAGTPDIDAALAPIPPDSPVIALVHEPDIAPQIAATNRVALQLSGHSHGGQVRLPFIGPLILPYMARKYPAGQYQVGSMTLYTNRGIGYISPPLRLFCHPEITLITIELA